MEVDGVFGYFYFWFYGSFGFGFGVLGLVFCVFIICVLWLVRRVLFWGVYLDIKSIVY